MNIQQRIFSLASLAFLLLSVLAVGPAGAFAAETFKTIDLNLTYPSFGGFNLGTNQDLVSIIGWLYYAIVTISGLAAFAMLVWGGVQWLTSSGNPGQIKDAQSRMSDALLGLGVVLGSYLILTIVNSGLTTLEQPKLEAVDATKSAESKSSKEQVLAAEVSRLFGVTMEGFDEAHLLWAKKTFERIFPTNFLKYVRGTTIRASSQAIGQGFSEVTGCRSISLGQYTPETLFSVALVHELSHIVRSCNDRGTILWDKHLETVRDEGYVTGYARTVCKDEKILAERQQDEDYAEMLTYYLNPDAQEQTATIAGFRDCEPGNQNPYTSGQHPRHFAVAREILGEYYRSGGTPAAPITPTVGIKVNEQQSATVAPGDTATISWNATGASSCSASTDGNDQDVWQGEQKTSGSLSFTARGKGLAMLHLVCFSPGKHAGISDSAQLMVLAQAPTDDITPSVDAKVRVAYTKFIKAPPTGLLCNNGANSSYDSPCRIQNGQAFSLTWASSPSYNVCTGEGAMPFERTESASGSEGPHEFQGTPNETKRYTITCTNPNNGKKSSDTVYLKEDSASFTAPLFGKPEWILETGVIKRAGTKVGLQVITRFDPGTEVTFRIFEADWSWLNPDETIRPRDSAAAPIAIVDSNGVAETTWEITEEDLKNAGDRYNFQFYFTASAGGVTSDSHSDYLLVP